MWNWARLVQVTWCLAAAAAEDAVATGYRAIVQLVKMHVYRPYSITASLCIIATINNIQRRVISRGCHFRSTSSEMNGHHFSLCLSDNNIAVYVAHKRLVHRVQGTVPLPAGHTGQKCHFAPISLLFYSGYKLSNAPVIITTISFINTVLTRSSATAEKQRVSCAYMRSWRAVSLR